MDYYDGYEEPQYPLLRRTDEQGFNPEAGGRDSLIAAIYALPRKIDEGAWPGILHSQRYLLLALAQCVKEGDKLYDGAIRRSLAYLTYTGLHSRRTTIKSLKGLEESGWIRVEPVDNKGVADYYLSYALGLHYELQRAEKALTAVNRLHEQARKIARLQQELHELLAANRAWSRAARERPGAQVIPFVPKKALLKPVSSEVTGEGPLPVL